MQSHQAIYAIYTSGIMLPGCSRVSNAKSVLSHWKWARTLNLSLWLRHLIRGSASYQLVWLLPSLCALYMFVCASYIGVTLHRPGQLWLLQRLQRLQRLQWLQWLSPQAIGKAAKPFRSKTRRRSTWFGRRIRSFQGFLVVIWANKGNDIWIFRLIIQEKTS